MPTISAALAALAQADFPLLIIGGNALEAHGYARFTVDVDCLITASSLEDLKAALARHGFQHAGRMSSFRGFCSKDTLAQSRVKNSNRPARATLPRSPSPC